MNPHAVVLVAVAGVAVLVAGAWLLRRRRQVAAGSAVALLQRTLTSEAARFGHRLAGWSLRAPGPPAGSPRCSATTRTGTISVGIPAAAAMVFSQLLPWNWQGWLALTLLGGVVPAGHPSRAPRPRREPR